MIEKAKDGWRKPRSIYRSFFGSGVLTAGVVLIVCLAVVLVCHLFETPPPEVNALRYTYAHSGMIVAIASMIFDFTANNDTYRWHDCLVGFDELSEENVRKDESSVKCRIFTLAMMGYHIEPRVENMKRSKIY